MKYIIGNWKANKNKAQAKAWIGEFLELSLENFQDKVAIIVCPPYPFLTLAHKAFKDTPIQLGSQDISFFHAGSYTGEVAANTLADLVSYCIIGHSERRRYFKETDATVAQKTANVRDFEIEPIVCVRGISDQIPKNVKIIAYEPVHAIGTGNNESVKKILEVKKCLHLDPDTIFIYGGSVIPDNSEEYLGSDEIDGVLLGGASLDPKKFYKIIKYAL